MESKIKFLMPDGSYMSYADYSKAYNLKPKQIAKYFWYTESRFIKDLEDFDELIVCHLLMQVLDAYRKKKGMPITVNSFNRTQEKQESLAERGFKTAKYSPHVAKLGADCDTQTEAETKKNVEMVKEVAKELGIKVRIGYKQYLAIGQTFIHIDVCPEYYGVGKIWHKQFHPKEWENEIEW